MKWPVAGRRCIEQFMWISVVLLELPYVLASAILECLADPSGVAGGGW